MALAVTEARKGLGKTWTNPCVGAVIVKDNRVIATGYHHRFGEAHAEIDALRHLSSPEAAKGATMYVTLEPCSHFGKTPPCANAIVRHGIARVVIGNVDPNPLVSGQGVAILRAAGVQVTIQNIGFTLNRAYAALYRRHRPTITLKYAMSLDGKINAAGRGRTMISSRGAYLDSQALRAEHQAVLVGENTFKVDNPALTVREQPVAFPPIRVVMVRDVNTVEDSMSIFKTDGPVWLLSEQSAHRQFPDTVEVFVAAHWTVERICQLLAAHNIVSLLVEGGSRIHAEFVKAQAVDRIVTYVSPIILGGSALPSVTGISTAMIADFQPLKVTSLMPDIKLETERRGQ
ncbi:bifunctional diaminohydroxyphosphoribosylaminopyrimidine deaminase/5-amino-6-(5-phosphoribosylamino)uracil reductase RibD [Secundilactobacillus kimchicus]|nr:bifunctional diaminohydroxyphosphoribosylaminopyrimidine deaminase/5-amino-6-(5-phosphoribosylamino)uracil reductase RibD [Secundilactobacillus kimchicus]